MNYVVYYSNEERHHVFEFDQVRILEKFLTAVEETNLTFKEEPEAGAVFFRDSAGKEIGFYMEGD